MAVRGTKNFVYFTDQSLGVGATGNVFFGRHKRRGEPCAIKVFRSTIDGGNKELQLRQREFDVMSKLNHENIVKFINIEQESHGNDRVLIMELCTGGSVYKMLEDPINAFGFHENEFLLFLGDITKALQYLRKQGVVHRDIKPGNILRYIKDDFSSVYKLTDFGAARELPENGEFMSLYGTEEYLHPDMYERALLPGSNRISSSYPKSFDASIDLWSLGVTLYHVATGCLPFQPYGGRKNKEAMHSIISQKKHGFISGIQLSKDGNVEWSKELPKISSLSWGLKRFLLPILSHLLESDRRHQWDFDSFFRAANNLVSMPIVHIFCAHSGSHNRLYLSNEDKRSFSHFQELLAEMSGIPSARQMLIHERWPIESLVPIEDMTSSDKHLHKTSQEFPLILVPTTSLSTDWTMVNIESPKQPTVPSGTDISEDAVFARHACAYVMRLRTQTNSLVSAQNLFEMSAFHLQKTLAVNLSKQKLLFESLLPSFQKCERLKNMEKISFSKEISLELMFHLEMQLKECFSKIVKKEEDDEDSFFKFCSKKLCQQSSTSSSCVKKQKRFVKEVEKVKDNFKEQRKKELSYNEQQIHKFDKARAFEWLKQSYDLYIGHCSLNTTTIWQEFKNYHSAFAKRKSEIERIENLLQKYQKYMLVIEDHLFHVLLKCNCQMSMKEEEFRGGRGHLDSGIDKSKMIAATMTTYPSVHSGDHNRTVVGSGGGKEEDVWQKRRWSDAENEPLDSGIEMLVSQLKSSLQKNSDSLRQTILTTNETDSLVYSLCSQIS